MSGPPVCAPVWFLWWIKTSFVCPFVSRSNKTNNSYHPLFLFWKKNNIIFLFLDIFEKLSFSSSLLSDETREYWMVIEGQVFCRRMVWFSSTPSPPLPVVSLTGDTGRLRKRNNLTGEGGGGEKGARRQESLVLYKSFNTLWRKVSHKSRNLR